METTLACTQKRNVMMEFVCFFRIFCFVVSSLDSPSARSYTFSIRLRLFLLVFHFCDIFSSMISFPMVCDRTCWSPKFFVSFLIRSYFSSLSILVFVFTLSLSTHHALKFPSQFKFLCSLTRSSFTSLNLIPPLTSIHSSHFSEIISMSPPMFLLLVFVPFYFQVSSFFDFRLSPNFLRLSSLPQH